MFPAIFTGFAQVLINRTFPNKELIPRARRLYHVLGVIQIILATAIGIFGAFVGIRVVADDFRGDMTGSFAVKLSWWSTAMMAASMLNLVATILFFRMMRTIRRNYRTSVLERFESF